MEFTTCYVELIPEGALTSFTVYDAYRYFVGQSWLLTSNSRSRREYLILMENVIVLDHFFNLTKKIDNLVVAYFFVTPCTRSIYVAAWSRRYQGGPEM